MNRAMAVWLFLALVSMTPTIDAGPLSSWHAGVNVRTELGTHPIRVGGGVELPGIRLSTVLDPMFWTDGQTDSDLWIGIPLADDQLAVLGGWRTTTIPLADGTQWHQKLLVGLAAPIPSLSVGWLETTLGVELATVMAKHGGGLSTEWIDFGEPAGYVDFVNFAMFLRFDYASR